MQQDLLIFGSLQKHEQNTFKKNILFSHPSDREKSFRGGIEWITTGTLLQECGRSILYKWMHSLVIK